MSRPDYYGNPAGRTDEIEVVRAIYAAFARRDLEGMLGYLAPDCVMHFVGTGRVSGRTEPYVGHEGVREYFADVERVWEELVLHAEDFRAMPGSVVVIGHVTGRHNGEPVHRSSVWTWRVHEGRATSVRVSDLGELNTSEPTST